MPSHKFTYIKNNDHSHLLKHDHIISVHFITTQQPHHLSSASVLTV